MKGLPYLLGILVSVIFGLSFLFTKGALDYLGPYQLLALRFLAAALVMTALRLTRVIHIRLKGRPLGAVLLLALFEPVIYFICETNGVNLTTTSEAGLMISTIPVVVTIAAALFLKEIPSPLQTVSIVISVVGVVLIALGGGGVSFSGKALGLLVLGGAAVAAGGYNVLARSATLTFAPAEITYVMLWSGAAFFTALSVFVHPAGQGIQDLWAALSHAPAWTAVLYLGVLSSVVAYFCLNYVLSKIEASRSAVMANLVTVVTVAAGVVFRHEPFYWYHFVGGILILVGVWGTNYFARGRTASTAGAQRD